MADRDGLPHRLGVYFGLVEEPGVPPQKLDVPALVLVAAVVAVTGLLGNLLGTEGLTGFLVEVAILVVLSLLGGLFLKRRRIRRAG